MERWFTKPSSVIIKSGDFERVDVILQADKKQEEFLKEYGKLVINFYLTPLQLLIASGIVPQLNMELVTKRLFSDSGGLTEVFRTFAGEVLAAWAEESFTNNKIGRKPKPHDSTPCFDAISLGQDSQGKTYLYFIQSKTTFSNVANNANSAAEDLGKLDNGEYCIELAGAVEEIAERQPDSTSKKAILRALVDPSCRRYRIVIVHGSKAPTVVLSNYDKHIQGEQCRRSASFLHLPDWEQSWQEVVKSAYEKINTTRSS